MGLSSPQQTASENSPVTTQADSMLANLNNNNGGVVSGRASSPLSESDAVPVPLLRVPSGCPLLCTKPLKAL